MEVYIVPNTPRFKRNVVMKDKEYIYLFSDNAKRTSVTSGTGIPLNASWYEEKYGKYRFPRKSQARIRGIHNAYPITTLYNEYHDQWSDKNFEQFKIIIDDDISQLLNALQQGGYKGIKILDKMFGDEPLSAMRHVAPKCFKYLNEKLQEVNINNMSLKPRRLDPMSNSGRNFKFNTDHSKLINDFILSEKTPKIY
jgi:hypothetical protein